MLTQCQHKYYSYTTCQVSWTEQKSNNPKLKKNRNTTRTKRDETKPGCETFSDFQVVRRQSQLFFSVYASDVPKSIRIHKHSFVRSFVRSSMCTTTHLNRRPVRTLAVLSEYINEMFSFQASRLRKLQLYEYILPDWMSGWLDGWTRRLSDWTLFRKVMQWSWLRWLWLFPSYSIQFN